MIITSWPELIILTMSAVFRLLERELRERKLRERDAPGAWERRSLGASEREIGTPGLGPYRLTVAAAVGLTPFCPISGDQSPQIINVLFLFIFVPVLFKC